MASVSTTHPLLHDTDGAGTAAAALIHRGLGLVSLVAWLSLLWEVKALIGWRGVDPAQTLLISLRASDPNLSFWSFPSHIFFDASDTSIVAGCIVGAALSVVATLGRWPRLMLPLSAALYLGYCFAARAFLSFQWDSLLIEASVLAALLAGSREDRAGWLAVRLLLFKLFFESGISKWQSAIGDWRDGSAMAHYYETSPLPTPLAWYAHHLPPALHTLESWATLVFELVLVWGIFGGRGPKRVALAAVLGFLVLDGLTSNYGFFLILTAVLAISLVSESTAARVCDTLRIRPHPDTPGGPLRHVRGALVLLWALLSLQAGLARFGGIQIMPELRSRLAAYRVVNEYHLFASVTRTRHEPEIQSSPDGQAWTAHALHHKPGPPDRAPSWVAPHQPRLDFRLWFHGLSWQRKTPPYVATLLGRVCHDPDAVQVFFADPLPPSDTTQFVRIVYWDHQLSPWDSDVWWTRTEFDTTRAIPCAQLRG